MLRLGKWAIALLGIAALVGTTLGVVPAAQAAQPLAAPTVGTTYPVQGMDFLTGIDCGSYWACVAVGAGSGNFLLVNNAHPETTPRNAPWPADILQGVACTGEYTCVAAGISSDHGAVIVTITNGVATATTDFPGLSIRGVDCVSATLCYAVGSGPAGGVVVPITNGTPGTPIVIPGRLGFAAIACAGGVCQAVGGTSLTNSTQYYIEPIGVVVQIAGGSVGPVKQVLGSGALQGVACRTAADCTAVGYAWPTQPSCVVNCGDLTMVGVYAPIKDGRPGLARPVPGTAELRGVACPDGAPATSPCIAVGGDHFRRSSAVVGVGGVKPGLLMRVKQVQMWNAISCSGTRCEVAGQLQNFGGVVASVFYGPRLL